MKNTTLTVVLLTFGILINLSGQFAQVEFFKSLDKTTFNLYSIHNINDAETLNLATLGFFENYSSSENQEFSEVGIQPTLFWDFSKNFSVGPSIYYNSIAGISQRLSVKYIFKNERLFITVVPSIGHFQQEGRIYAETFVQFQLNIPIKESMSFLGNGQFLNVWDAITTHTRSFQKLRAGILFKRHQLGVGFDLDRYGPQALSTNSIGLYYSSIF